MVVSGEPWRDSAIHIHASILPQTPPPIQAGTYHCSEFPVLYRRFLSPSRSVVSDSLQCYGLEPARLLCPWDSPGKDTGVSCHFLFQGIFPTQGSNQWVESTSPVIPALADRFFTNKPPGKPAGPCWLPLKMMTFENNFDIIHSQLSSTGPQSVSHSAVSRILKCVAISFSR